MGPPTVQICSNSKVGGPRMTNSSISEVKMNAHQASQFIVASATYNLEMLGILIRQYFKHKLTFLMIFLHISGIRTSDSDIYEVSTRHVITKVFIICRSWVYYWSIKWFLLYHIIITSFHHLVIIVLSAENNQNQSLDLLDTSCSTFLTRY